MLKNLMETIVIQKFDSFAHQYENCKCQRCREDILALTLNQLKPKYVMTDEGELYAKLTLLSQEEDYNLTMVIAKAIKMVNDNPRHSKEDIQHMESKEE